MEKAIKKGVIFSTFVVLLHLLVIFYADGTTDNYYTKVSSGKKKSMIIGTSRAFIGIVPEVINPILNLKNSENSIYNFAFTLNNSPYGEIYYNAIEKKLASKAKEGVYILSIFPWSLSSVDDNDNTSLLYNLENVISHPNYEYFLEKYNKGWGSVFIKKIERRLFREFSDNFKSKSGSWTYVTESGRLVVNTSSDSSIVNQRTESKLKTYRKIAPEKKYSEYRLMYLIKTIELLNKHGDVYLVRLPTDERLLSLENETFPNFDKQIEHAVSLSSGYYDMSILNSKFEYTDGNHLTTKSSEDVSELIANWIKEKSSL